MSRHQEKPHSMPFITRRDLAVQTTNQMLQHISARIECALQVSGLSGAALSVRLEICPATLSNLRHQRFAVGLKLLLKLTEVLDLTLSELLGEHSTDTFPAAQRQLVYTEAADQMRNNIVLFMTVNQLSGRAFSQHSGVSASLVQDMLQGRTNPTLLTLVKLAQALNCGIETLLRDDLPFEL
jgi:transcriptional regulator with XRE-family HTH domain